MQNGSTLVAPKQIYNAYKDLLETAGFPGIDEYMIDPESPQGQQMTQQKMQQLQQPNPQVMAIQAQQQIEQQKRQLEAQKAQMDAQKAQQDAQIKLQESQQSLQIKAQEMALKERELAIRERELEIKANQAVNDMVKHNDDIAVKLTDIEAKTATDQDANFQENKQLNIVILR